MPCAAGRQRFFILDMVGVAYRRYEFGEGSSIGGLLGMDYEIPNVSVDWDDAMRVINSWCDKQVTAMEKPTYLQRTAALKKFGREVAGLRKKSKFSPRKGSGWWADAIAELSKYRSWRGFYKDNPGEALVSLLFPSLFRVDQLQDKATMQMSLTQVALALGAYKADHGEYPEELDELRRDYLKEIPNDIFVNKPPRYRREGGGYLLYSVGSDMKDDGGKELDRRSGSEDIVMRAK